MHVDITRIDKLLPLPQYESAGAVGFDLVTRETTEIPAGEIVLIPGNVVVNTPPGYALLLLPRSSLARKKGLICPHSLGVIDQDYCGPEDELMVQVQNITKETVIVERGERIAQGIFVRVEQATWNEVKDHAVASRGGFGSTGQRI